MKPMLAVNANLSKVQFPVIVQPKLDGIRTVVKDGVLMSRSLKPIRNKHCQALFSHLEGYDGELIVDDPCAEDVFQKTTSGVMTSSGEPDVKFHVFDMWNHPNMPYKERYHYLTQCQNVEVVYNVVAHSLEELTNLTQRYVEKGYEGLILRSPESLYKYGRSTVKEGYLLKIKLFEDAEFEVIGFTELLHNENEARVNGVGRSERSSHKEFLRPSGMMGSLIVKYKDTSFEIGTGFTYHQRKEVFENQEYYLGQLAKVQYQSIGMKDLPRFPSFKGFRSKDDL